MTTTPIACPLRVAAPPLKGQRLRPGKAGSAAFWYGVSPWNNLI